MMGWKRSFLYCLGLSLVLCVFSMQFTFGVNQGHKLSLSGKIVSHSWTINRRHARLAIDGSLDTYSHSSAPPLSSKRATWEVNLDSMFNVSCVQVSSGPSSELNNFQVNVLNAQGAALCHRHENGRPLAPGSTNTFCCPSLLQGSAVQVQKLDGLELVLAEVAVYEGGGKVGSSQAIDILPGRRTVQIGTMGFQVPEFAVDHDEGTCAVACLPCNGSISNGRGWWAYDFEKVVTVARVEIVSCSYRKRANYLRDSVIGISSSRTTDPGATSICTDHTRTFDDIPPRFTVSIKCEKPLTGRYLLLTRKTSASYRPDVIALAEIRVFDEGGSQLAMELVPKVQEMSETDLLENIRSKKWFMINLLSMRTAHIGTHDFRDSEYAIDGDRGTFSLSCAPCDPPSGIGWWRIYLDRTYNIVAVQIISSTIQYYSNLLQEFIVYVMFRDARTICSVYDKRRYIEPSMAINLACSKPIVGDSVVLQRSEFSSFRADAISLAEILIFAAVEGGRSG